MITRRPATRERDTTGAADATPLAVETRGLSKRYGTTLAVANLDLRLRRGEVYGFLGPNGAGKTTTLRMLVGLIRPSGGDAWVLGQRAGSAGALARVGALIEEPAFYPHLSGRDNLRVLADYAGVGLDRVEPALADVGLESRADAPFRAYSMGMKQRLGLAAALLKDPTLLILDEPTNGLDPAGIAEMRALVRGLGRGDRTVLLSSHLIGEVEQICDRVGIIRAGRLITEGSVDELRGAGRLRVRAEPLDEASRVVAALPGIDAVDVVDGVLSIGGGVLDAVQVNRALVGAGISVSELTSERASLEHVFLGLTEEEPIDVA